MAVKPLYYDDNGRRLGPQSANALVYLFDACYKRGAVHAFQLDDTDEAERFVDANRRDGHYAVLCDTDSFGRLTEGRECNFYEWQYTLGMWARRQRCHKIIDAYLEGVGNSRGVYGVVYPVCMDFYLHGIHDFCMNPREDLELLLSQPLMKMTEASNKQGAPYCVKRPVVDWVRDVQLYCYERKRIAESLPESERMAQPKFYDTFAKAYWQYTVGAARRVKGI